MGTASRQAGAAAGADLRRSDEAAARSDAPSGALRLAIVADVRLFRDGLEELIGRRAGMTVVASVGSGEADRIDALRPPPDVVLWDAATQPDLDAIREFITNATDADVLVVAVPELEADIVALAEAGIAGFVTRDADLDALVAAIHRTAEGELVCSPRVAGALLRQVGRLSRRDADRVTASLTPREAEIIRLVGRGLTNKEIAAALTVELSTVKNHIHNALEKLGVHRRSEAVARLRTALAGQGGARGIVSRQHDRRGI